jgi:hypothetical protein
MRSFSIKHIEEFGKKRLKKIVESGEEFKIVAGYIDHIGDSKITLCSRCSTPVWIRPWLFETMDQHDIKVICVDCTDPKDLREAVTAEVEAINREKDK